MPGTDHHFGAALAAGLFSLPSQHHRDLELAVGAPGTEKNAGSVVRFLKTAAGAEVPERITPDRYGLAAKNADFGSALASGDFDGDGLDDLAIGAPGFENGVVIVQYSRPGNPWARLEPPADRAGPRHFGTALAAGFLDNDDLADLVIGEAGSAKADEGDPGRVWVVRGRAAPQPVNMADAALLSVPAADAQRNDTRFGASVAIGNFVLREDLSQPALDDIAVGAPRFDNAGGRADVGRVYVFQAGLGDPRGAGYGVRVTLEPLNGWERYAKEFGFALAAGNFNDDRDHGEAAVDLAIGAPESSIPTDDGLDTTFGQPSGKPRTPAAGLVFLAPHVGGAVSVALRVLSQDRMGLSEKSDRFGFAVAAGDYNRDGIDDLAIGSPNERVRYGLETAAKQAGAVFIRFGNDGGWAVGGGIPQIPTACFDYIDTLRVGLGKGDHFGNALLATLFDDDNAVDLIVGAPDADVVEGNDRVKDAGAVWVGLNRETTPVPLDGSFTGEFRDDPCGGARAAEVTADIRDREGALCGSIATDRGLCFTVDDEEVTVTRIDLDVAAANASGSFDMAYRIRDREGKKVGTLYATGTLIDADGDGPDEDDDLQLELRFKGSGLDRSVTLVLERQ